jgi:hypothetical protein
MKDFMAVMGAVALLILGLALILPMRLCSEAADVAVDEAGPRALLKKYQWFKDASAQLDKKQADVKVYEARFKSMEESYKGHQRIEWAREDREQYNLWTSEVAGIKASYNGLAAEYNAAMVKINWAFCNKGELPKGAEQPLPREYKPYITQ